MCTKFHFYILNDDNCIARNMLGPAPSIGTALSLVGSVFNHYLSDIISNELALLISGLVDNIRAYFRTVLKDE